MIDYEEAVAPVSNEQLELIAKLAERQVELEKQVERAEEELKVLKRQLATVQEVELPEAMQAAGCLGFTLRNGSKIDIKEGITASISESKRERVLEWLRANGHDDIISTEVSASLGKGSADRAEQLTNIMLNLGIIPSVKEGVNTGTFKALLNELRNEGVDIPYSELGAFLWKRAIIK